VFIFYKAFVRDWNGRANLCKLSLARTQETNNSPTNTIASMSENEKSQENREDDTSAENFEYPTKKVLLPVVFSICLASFLASLVR
jgi:hypothetical protein